MGSVPGLPTPVCGRPRVFSSLPRGAWPCGGQAGDGMGGQHRLSGKGAKPFCSWLPSVQGPRASKSVSESAGPPVSESHGVLLAKCTFPRRRACSELCGCAPGIHILSKLPQGTLQPKKIVTLLQVLVRSLVF